MKIYDTVATEAKAKEVINEYVNDNNLTDGFFRNSSAQCECGETNCLTWRNEDTLLSVAICESCGDDDAFVSDILEVK